MRRGVTLFELLLALTIIGILAALVVPGSAALADRLSVEHEAARLLVAYRTAWRFARSHQALAVLRITPDSLTVRTVPGAGSPDTTLVWLAPGPALAGVTLASPPHTAVLGPDGVGLGLANARHILTRGGISREVVVSRLGRVRIAP